MITVTTSESAVQFEFDGSQHYLYDGTMEVPFNSLILVEDESDMITFRKASTNDILFSAMYTEFSSLGETKDEVVGALEGMMFAEGGGGGGVDPEDVVEIVESALTDYWTSAQTQSAINQASSGKQDTLVSGTNIKTINNQSLLGSGNITISGGGATYEYYSENTETKSANIHIEDTDEQTSGDLGVDGSSAMMFASGTETDVEETIVRNTGINVNPWEASMSYDKSIDDETTTNSYVSVGETVGLGVQSDIDPQPYSHLDVHKGDISLEVSSDEDHITTFAVSNSAVTINGENVATVNDIPSYSAGTGIDITSNVISVTGGTGGAGVVEVTQAEYDALVSGGTVDPDVLYIISDASEINLSGYALSSAVTAEITAAVSGKADSSAVTQSLSSKQDTLTAGEGISITNNVISSTRGSDIPLAEVSGNKYVSGGNLNLQDELEGGIRGFAISTTDTEQGAARQWYLTELQYDGQLYKVDRVVDSGGTVLRSDESRYITQGDFDENIQMSVAYKVNLNQLDEGDGTIIDYALLQDSPSIIGVVMNEDEDEIKKWYPCSANIDEQALYVYTESNIIKYTLRVDEGTGDFVADKEVLPYGSSYTSAQTDTLLASKQDTLVSGTNIKTINNQSLLGSGNIDIQGGGGSVTVDQSLDSGSTNPVANSAITAAIDAKIDKNRFNAYFIKGVGWTSSQKKLGFTHYNPSTNSSFEDKIYALTINNYPSISSSTLPSLTFVETSAITTSMTSSSTDAQVPSAKAVYDQLGGLKLVSLTQSEYDALATKDSTTIYFIKDNSN